MSTIADTHVIDVDDVTMTRCAVFLNCQTGKWTEEQGLYDEVSVVRAGNVTGAGVVFACYLALRFFLTRVDSAAAELYCTRSSLHTDSNANPAHLVLSMQQCTLKPHADTCAMLMLSAHCILQGRISEYKMATNGTYTMISNTLLEYVSTYRRAHACVRVCACARVIVIVSKYV